MKEARRYHESAQHEETLALLTKVGALHERFPEANGAPLAGSDAELEFVHAWQLRDIPS